MSLFSDQSTLSTQKNVWAIDSEQFPKEMFDVVNDVRDHWSLTLKIDTNIDVLLTSINNNPGWVKVRVTFCWHECVYLTLLVVVLQKLLDIQACNVTTNATEISS